MTLITTRRWSVDPDHAPRQTKVYLSGPMSGLPDHNRAAFIEAAERLRSWGYEVHSPVESNLETYGSWEEATRHPWQEHLARDVAAVPTCQLIAMMSGWEASRGARLELHIARELGYDVISAEDGCPIVGLDDRVDAGSDHAPTLPTEGSFEGSFQVVDGVSLGGPSDPWVNYEDNPARQTQVTGGMKDDKGKSRVDLIPSAPLVLVGHVLAYGARKYKPHNWRLGLRWSDTYASMMRHLLAWNDGEQNDPETGLSHLGHALCQLMFLAEYELTRGGINDHWRYGDDPIVTAAEDPFEAEHARLRESLLRYEDTPVRGAA